MAEIVGGLRARLIHDSLFHMVDDGLHRLGWFDAGRRHRPLQIVARPMGLDEEVPLNTIAIADANDIGTGAEMGSNATTDTWTFYVDFFAQDDSLGKHVIHDIKDLLRGKMPSHGYGNPVLRVYDWRDDPPTPLFFCDLEDVMADRAHNFPHPWQRFWYTVRLDVVDDYDDDSVPGEWNGIAGHTWADYAGATWAGLHDTTWEQAE